MESTVSIALHVVEVGVLLGGLLWRLSIMNARLMVIERLMKIVLRRSGIEDPENHH